MSLRPYKFQVVAVVQEIGEDGQVVGEQTVSAGGQPFTLFGVEALREWADAFPGLLESAET